MEVFPLNSIYDDLSCLGRRGDGIKGGESAEQETRSFN